MLVKLALERSFTFIADTRMNSNSNKLLAKRVGVLSYVSYMLPDKIREIPEIRLNP